MLAEDDRFDIVGHKQFHEFPPWHGYTGYVCTAALSSEKACQSVAWSEVVKANVELPMRLMRLAKSCNAPVIVFSTSGVYRIPGVRTEADDVEPQNRYTTSKLMMEYQLSQKYDGCYIFRIPFVCLFGNHQMDMANRVRGWSECEDVETSIVYQETLIHAVNTVLESPELVPAGIYNVASETVFLADFVKENFKWQGRVVPAHSMNKTPSTCLGFEQSERSGADMKPKGIILAGGKGTRLLPLTANLPKCLVDINGRPMIEYILDQMQAGGIKEVQIICTARYLEDMISTLWQRTGMKLGYVPEHEPQGEGAAMRLVADYMREQEECNRRHDGLHRGWTDCEDADEGAQESRNQLSGICNGAVDYSSFGL